MRLCVPVLWALHLAAVQTTATAGETERATADFSLTVPVGAVNDRLSGTAHLLEHLKIRSLQSGGDRLLQAIPRSAINAFTETYATTYFIQTDPQHAEAVLQVFAAVLDRLEIDENDLVQERNVVLQEISQRLSAHPDARDHQRLSQVLFRGTQLEHNSLGLPSHVSSITLEDVLALDAAFYRDSRVLFSVVGPVDAPAVAHAVGARLAGRAVERLIIDTRAPIDAAALLAEIGEPVAGGPAIRIPPRPPQRLNVAGTSEFPDRIRQQRVYCAGTDWRSVLPARDLVLSLIGSRLPQGLQRVLTGYPQIATSWHVDITWAAAGYWILTLDVWLAEGATPPDAVEAVDRYLSALPEAIEPTVFERLKKRLVRSVDRRESNPRAFGTWLFESVAAFGAEARHRQRPAMARLSRESAVGFAEVLSGTAVREALLVIARQEE